MDKKDVLIEIKDRHSNEEGAVEKIELTTTGTLSGTADDYSLIYTELDEELAGSTTTLRVTNKSYVTMTRTGKYNTQMVLEKGRRHSCHYDTPYGAFVMGVFARDVSSDVNETGGILNFKYSIDIGSDYAGENELTFLVKEKTDV